MDESPTEQPESSYKKKTQEICGICEEIVSRYCCPRCGVLYCSLTCYKSEKHSDCSENFYRDCVVQEIADKTFNKESHQKMTDYLNYHLKQQEVFDEQLKDLIKDDDVFELDSDDEDVESLENRVKNIDIDNTDDLWNILTTDERNEFEAFVNQGDVTELIPQWEAWWSFRSKEDFDVKSEEKWKVLEQRHMKTCPQLIKVPEFSTLSKTEPPPSFKNNLINVLSCYAFIMRYFNGEPEPVEATAYLLSICDNLNHNTNFEEHRLSTRSIANNCFQGTLIQTDEKSIQVMKYDTFIILKGPSVENKSFYCRAALSHLHTLFGQAIAAEKKSRSTNKTGDTKKMTNNDKSMTNGKTPKSYDNDTINNANYTKSTESNGKCLHKADCPNGVSPNSKLKDSKEFSKKFPVHGKEHFPALDLTKIKKCMKKLEFYLSYVESRNTDEILRNSQDNEDATY